MLLLTNGARRKAAFTEASGHENEFAEVNDAVHVQLVRDVGAGLKLIGPPPLSLRRVLPNDWLRAKLVEPVAAARR